MSIRAAEILAVVSYMTEMAPDSLRFHSWKVALFAHHIASVILPESQNEVFYAGLLHDIGAVSSSGVIAHEISDGIANSDQFIFNHPLRSAALLETLPGMGKIANIIRCHHEHIDGNGYPENLQGNMIPLESQIVAIVDTVESKGCLAQGAKLLECLLSLAKYTGNKWSSDIWTALLQSTKNADLFRSLMDENALKEAIAKYIKEIPVPEKLDNEAGAEKAILLIPAIIDLKDPNNSGHSLRVAKYAREVAIQLGLNEEELQLTYHAALVHDCGRLGLPQSLINKPGRISDQELKIVRRHADLTIHAFNCLPGFDDLVKLGYNAGHDHERFDGTGYPDSLSGDSIPLVSRIISVVDAFDAMTSASSYRMLTPIGATNRLEQEAGKQFDPLVVQTLVKAVNNGTLAVA